MCTVFESFYSEIGLQIDSAVIEKLGVIKNLAFFRPEHSIAQRKTPIKFSESPLLSRGVLSLIAN